MTENKPRSIIEQLQSLVRWQGSRRKARPSKGKGKVEPPDVVPTVRPKLHVIPLALSRETVLPMIHDMTKVRLMPPPAISMDSISEILLVYTNMEDDITGVKLLSRTYVRYLEPHTMFHSKLRPIVSQSFEVLETSLGNTHRIFEWISYTSDKGLKIFKVFLDEQKHFQQGTFISLRENGQQHLNELDSLTDLLKTMAGQFGVLIQMHQYMRTAFRGLEGSAFEEARESIEHGLWKLASGAGGLVLVAGELAAEAHGIHLPIKETVDALVEMRDACEILWNKRMADAMNLELVKDPETHEDGNAFVSRFCQEFGDFSDTMITRLNGMQAYWKENLKLVTRLRTESLGPLVTEINRSGLAAESATLDASDMLEGFFEAVAQLQRNFGIPFEATQRVQRQLDKFKFKRSSPNIAHEDRLRIEGPGVTLHSKPPIARDFCRGRDWD